MLCMANHDLPVLCMQEKQKLQARMQAGKKASKLHEDALEEGQQREEELKKARPFSKYRAT